MLASKGVLTQLGGRTSHAALVARQYGIPTICGCGARADRRRRPHAFTANGVTVKEGDVITIDGTLGEVYNVALDTEPATRDRRLRHLHGAGRTSSASWACAPTPTPPSRPAQAIEFGAEGIGLCRTEHMFLGDERVPLVQDMILAEDEDDPRRGARQAAPACSARTSSASSRRWAAGR